MADVKQVNKGLEVVVDQAAVRVAAHDLVGTEPDQIVIQVSIIDVFVIDMQFLVTVCKIHSQRTVGCQVIEFLPGNHQNIFKRLFDAVVNRSL